MCVFSNYCLSHFISLTHSICGLQQELKLEDDTNALPPVEMAQPVEPVVDGVDCPTCGLSQSFDTFQSPNPVAGQDPIQEAVEPVVGGGEEDQLTIPGYMQEHPHVDEETATRVDTNEVPEAVQPVPPEMGKTTVVGERIPETTAMTPEATAMIPEAMAMIPEATAMIPEATPVIKNDKPPVAPTEADTVDVDSYHKLSTLVCCVNG